MLFRPIFVLYATTTLLTVGTNGNANAQDSLESALARMDTAAKAFRSMTANIRKLSHTAVINEDAVDSGAISLKRPRDRDMRMLIDFTQPDAKSVAVHDHVAEIYYPKMRTVQEYDIGKSRELFDQFFLVGFGSSRRDLETAYTVRFLNADAVNGQKAALLELIPKSKQVLAHLKRFELWVSSSGETTGYPLQQKFYMPGGDYILATYSNMKINPPLSDSNMKLNLPKGVKREYPQK